MKTRHLITFTTAIILLIIAIQDWEIPYLDKVIKEKIQTSINIKEIKSLNYKNSHLRLLPFRLTFNNVEVKLNNNDFTHQESIKIMHISVRPHLFKLITGALEIYELKIENSDIALNIVSKGNSKSAENFEISSILKKIPLYKIQLSNIGADIQYQDNKNKLIFKTKNINLKAYNKKNYLEIFSSLPSSNIYLDQKYNVENLNLKVEGTLADKNLSIKKISLEDNNNKINVKGFVTFNIKKKTIQQSNLDVSVETSFTSIRNYLSLLNIEAGKFGTLPLKGNISLNTNLSVETEKNINADATFQLNNFSYRKFKLDQINGKGKYSSENNKTQLKKLNLITRGANATLSQVNIDTKNLSFEMAKLSINSFNLQKFIKNSLGPDIPASLIATGKTECKGNFKNFFITCDGQLDNKSIFVNTSKGDSLIKLQSAELTGSFDVDLDKVSYKTDIKTLNSEGHSDGFIDYVKGFEIKYKTPDLDLSEIHKISDLEISGFAKIHGSTKGDSNSATFSLNADTKNFIFEQFKLGELSTQLSYKEGHIFLNKISGTIMGSRYLGDLNINLDKSTINGDVQLPFLDLKTLQQAIYERLPLDTSLTGSGSGIVRIDSPLDLTKLNLNLKSRIYNSTIEGQHIDSIVIDASANDGIITINESLLKERQSKANLLGTINLKNDTFDLSYYSQQIYISDLINKTPYEDILSGTFKIEGEISGPFELPKINGRLFASTLNFYSEVIKPMTGEFSIDTDNQYFFFKGAERFTFELINDKDSKNYHMSGKMKDFDLSRLLSSALELDTIEDYHIYTSGYYDLLIPKKDAKKINGFFNYSGITISSNRSELKTKGHGSLDFKNGNLSLSNLRLLSDQNEELTISSVKNSRYPIDFKINGVLQLSLLQIFTPFLETFEGLSSMRFEIISDYEDTEFIGSAFIEDAYVRIPDINHAIENLNIDILFNHKVISFNSIKAKFATGTVLGDGKVGIEQLSSPDTSINIQATDLDMHLPDKVKTQGDLNLKVTGKGLPLLLTGEYDVSGGLITMEIGESEAESQNAHDIFLPKKLKESTDSPVKMDIAINPLNPIQMINTFIDGEIEGKMKVLGDPENPTFTGQLKVSEVSHLKFKEILFDVADSSIQFTNSQPPNPIIYMLAKTRYKQHDIEMEVQGESEDPRIKLTSQPDLSEQEIISLLTLGYTGSQTTTTSPNQNSQSTLEIGTSLFSQNPLGKEFKDRFGFEVQFSSSFDEETSVASPKISASRPFGEKVTVTGSQQLGQNRKIDAKVRYELREDLSGILSYERSNIQDINQNNNINQDNSIFGVDVEFRKEFD